MAITYTWEVTGLRTDKVHGSDNIIVQTYWKKIGIDENGNRGEFVGATPFSPDSISKDTKFTPFEKLKEEDVLKWIQASVVDLYEDHVNAQIAKQIQEKTAIKAHLPWKPKENT